MPRGVISAALKPDLKRRCLHCSLEFVLAMPQDGKKAVSKERQSMTEKPTKEQERSAAVALAKWLGTSEYPANRLQGFYRESPELKAIVQSVETGKLLGVKALCTNHPDIISYRVDGRLPILFSVPDDKSNAPTELNSNPSSEIESEALKSLRAEIERVSAELAAAKEAYKEIISLVKREPAKDKDVSAIKSTTDEILSLLKKDKSNE